jgi:hypothetical protein
MFAGLMGDRFAMLVPGLALTSAANVRTLGLVEVLFAQGVSTILFRQAITAREARRVTRVGLLRRPMRDELCDRCAYMARKCSTVLFRVCTLPILPSFALNMSARFRRSRSILRAVITSKRWKRGDLHFSRNPSMESGSCLPSSQPARD